MIPVNLDDADWTEVLICLNVAEIISRRDKRDTDADKWKRLATSILNQIHGH